MKRKGDAPETLTYMPWPPSGVGTSAHTGTTSVFGSDAGDISSDAPAICTFAWLNDGRRMPSKDIAAPTARNSQLRGVGSPTTSLSQLSSGGRRTWTCV